MQVNIILEKRQGVFIRAGTFIRVNMVFKNISSTVSSPDSRRLHKIPHGPYEVNSGEPGLVDKVLALHAGSPGFESRRGPMSE